jgi:hypothetical protein
MVAPTPGAPTTAPTGGDCCCNTPPLPWGAPELATTMPGGRSGELPPVAVPVAFVMLPSVRLCCCCCWNKDATNMMKIFVKNKSKESLKHANLHN